MKNKHFSGKCLLNKVEETILVSETKYQALNDCIPTASLYHVQLISVENSSSYLKLSFCI